MDARRLLASLALALLTLCLLVPARTASAHESDGVDLVVSCSTAKRAGGQLVTRVRWESGRKVRRVNMTAETRLFGGDREWRTPAKRKADPRIVKCVALRGGTVVVRTMSQARYAFVPPAPAEVAPPAPAAWATWTAPVTLSVPGLDASWQAREAVAAWNVGLPEGLKVALTEAPCVEGQTGCVAVRERDLTGVQAVGLGPGDTMWGGATFTQDGGVMLSCEIGLSPVVPLERRPHVMLHELGHCLGLPHWDTEDGESWTVMGTGDSEPAALDVTEWDLAWLAAAYAGS